MRIVAFDMGKNNFAWAKVYIPDNDKLISRCIVEEFDLLSLDKDNIYKSLHHYLISHEHQWVDCEVVLIEQQMKTNITALKLSQHVMAFWLIRHPNKNSIEFSSVHKTRTFGLTNATKPQRKKFTIDCAAKILAHDPVVTELFNMHNKKDDISDCILMCMAYGCRFAQLINDLQM